MVNFDPKIPRNHISTDGDEFKGKLNIMIAGFSRQKIVSIDEIVKAIEILPDFHLENFNIVRYDPLKWFLRIPMYFGRQVRNLNLAGSYHDDSRGILLYSFKNKKDFYHTLYHEIGHFVYHHIIGYNNKHQWAMHTHNKSDHVSKYAKKNANEGFAESYAHYILHHEDFKRFELKFSFFDQIVFKGFVPEVKEL